MEIEQIKEKAKELRYLIEMRDYLSMVWNSLSDESNKYAAVMDPESGNYVMKANTPNLIAGLSTAKVADLQNKIDVYLLSELGCIKYDIHEK